MVLDYLCCDAVMSDDRASTRDDDSITCSTDEGILECDYDTQVTKLYHSIEERQWEEVLYFLETGKWYSSSIFSAFGDTGDSASVEARTWVTALDDDGNVRWCQLPLHAAVTFLAPFAIINKLIEIYPKSVRCADDQDMLPLHYAFRFGADDDVVLHLLEKFPQAIGKKAVKDRLPLDLAQYGPRPERGKIIDFYMQSAVRNAKASWDQEYEKMVDGMKTESNAVFARELTEKSEQLEAARLELASLNQQIEDLKLEAAGETRDTPENNGLSGNISIRSTRSYRSATNSANTSSPGTSAKQLVSTAQSKANTNTKQRKKKDETVAARGRTKVPRPDGPRRSRSSEPVESRRPFNLFGKRK